MLLKFCYLVLRNNFLRQQMTDLLQLFKIIFGKPISIVVPLLGGNGILILFFGLFFLVSTTSSAQRTIVLTQTESNATIGLDRKDFGGPYSQGYHHDFDLGSSVSPCERIVSINLDIVIQSYTPNIPPGCSHSRTYYNVYYGCDVYNGMGGSCPTANIVDEPNFPPAGAPYNQTYNNACNPNTFDFGGNFSVDIVPVYSTACPDGQDAINQGHIAYTYTITLTIETDVESCTGTGCLAGATTTRACDDLDPCTINDMETILDCDGSVCTPCMGTFEDDDGDGVCNFNDICPGFDDLADADGDGTPDGCDACPNSATGDTDGDTVCDDVDICPGFDDTMDTDGDGTPDGCDACPNAPGGDSDGDTVCDDVDVCPGFDDLADADGDGTPDGCDVCPNSATDDTDGDSVCDDVDVCPGFNDNDDVDGDGTPDGCDTCPFSATDDSDGDTVCDDVDVCPGFDDRVDTDNDGVPD
ncbi:MAG: hypothetical protein D6772_16395, partial [Bacteroidetes bacterium]